MFFLIVYLGYWKKVLYNWLHTYCISSWMLYWYQQIISVIFWLVQVQFLVAYILFWMLFEHCPCCCHSELPYTNCSSHFLWDLVSNVSYKCLAFKFLSVFLLHVELIIHTEGMSKTQMTLLCYLYKMYWFPDIQLPKNNKIPNY